MWYHWYIPQGRHGQAHSPNPTMAGNLCLGSSKVKTQKLNTLKYQWKKISLSGILQAHVQIFEECKTILGIFK